MKLKKLGSNNRITPLYFFEQKIIRKIFGCVKEGDIWRKRNKCEIFTIFEGGDI